MATPTAADVVALWERGRRWSSPARGVLLADAGAGAEVSADLPVGERDRVLLELRRRMFGGTLELVGTCPQCENDLEFSVEIDELVREPAASEVEQRVVAEGYEVVVRSPRAGDLVDAVGSGDRAVARRVVLERAVVSATLDGAPVDAAALPDSVQAAIGEAIGSADPLAEIAFAVTCPVCEFAWQPALDIAAYLWAEVTSTAQRLMWDVHTLASAYGWSEEAVLAMSAARRQAYLDLLS